MNKLIFAIIALLFAPMAVFATVTSLDYAGGVLQPLMSQWSAQFKASYFTATSTSIASTFPYASSTAFSADTLCVNGDCRTSWPTGGGISWPWTVATNFGTSTNSTTTPTWFKTGMMASSTSYFVNASTTNLSALNRLWIGNSQVATTTTVCASMNESCDYHATTTTDGVQAIAQAIKDISNAGGGVVHVKDGTYQCKDMSYLSLVGEIGAYDLSYISNVTVIGEGYNTIIDCSDDAVASPTGLQIFRFLGGANITFQNMYFIGQQTDDPLLNQQYKTPSMLYFFGTDNVRLNNLWSLDGLEFVNIRSVTNFDADNIRVYNNEHSMLINGSGKNINISNWSHIKTARNGGDGYVQTGIKIQDNTEDLNISNAIFKGHVREVFRLEGETTGLKKLNFSNIIASNADENYTTAEGGFNFLGTTTDVLITNYSGDYIGRDFNFKGIDGTATDVYVTNFSIASTTSGIVFANNGMTGSSIHFSNGSINLLSSTTISVEGIGIYTNNFSNVNYDKVSSLSDDAATAGKAVRATVSTGGHNFFHSRFYGIAGDFDIGATTFSGVIEDSQFMSNDIRSNNFTNKTSWDTRRFRGNFHGTEASPNYYPDYYKNIITTIDRIGVGTTTPFWAITVSSSTRPQIGITDNEANFAWILRAGGNRLFIATSTATATSSSAAFYLDENAIPAFPSIKAASGNNCLQIDTNGKVTNTGSACATGSGTWAFTPSTYGGVANQSTSTDLWIKDARLLASTTLFTMASTTGLTASTIWNTGLTPGQLIATDADNKLVSTTTIGNNQLQNSTISGVALGSNLANHTTNSTLSGTSYNGSAAVSDWGINLGNANWWTARQNFTNASTSQLTATSSVWFTGITNAILSTDANGLVSATTSIGTNYLTGVLPIANGGTATSTQVTNGVNYFDGTRITSGTALIFDGTKLGIASTTPTNPLSVFGAIDTGGVTGGYKQDSNLILYSSTTNFMFCGGVGACSGIYGFATSSDPTSSIGSTAFGYQALNLATTSPYNTAIGYQTLKGSGSNTFSSAGLNTAIGYQALASLQTGNSVTAIGYQAGTAITSGSNNVTIGSAALQSLTTGVNNTALGNSALRRTNGSRNVGVGFQAGQGSSGQNFSNATLLGNAAGFGLTTGSNNIFIGYDAASTTTTGGTNICIGYQCILPSANGSNQLNIGNLIFGTSITGTGPNFNQGIIGIATTTPSHLLTLASSTGPQLALTDTTSSSTAWTLRSIANTLYIATSTATATSSVAALTIDPFGKLTFNNASSSIFTPGTLCLDTCRTTWPSASVSGGTTGMLTAWTDATTLTSTSSPTAAYYWATSTTASWFPYASSTAFGATTLCLNGDCRSAWPTGGGSWPWTALTNYGTSTNATTTPTWFKTGFFASSTSHFVAASTSRVSASDSIATDVLQSYTGGYTGAHLILQDSIFQAHVAGGQYNFDNGTDVSAILDASGITGGSKTFTFPNTSGTFCLIETCNSYGWIFSALTNYGTSTNATTTAYTAPAYFASSSLASQFPYASTTQLSSTSLCMGGDCRTAWPSAGGGAWPFVAGTNWATSTQSTTTAIQAPSFFASSTLASQFPYASSTALSADTLFVGAGSGDSSTQYGSDTNAWAEGSLSSDNSFRIASSTGLSSNVALTILKSSLNIGIGTTSPGTLLSIQGVANFVASGLSTIYNGLQVVGQFILPIGAAESPTVAGDIALDTTSGQIKYGDGSATRVLGNGYIYRSFRYATSSAFTGTTTLALGPAYIGETWSGVQCFTNTGTLNVHISDGTNFMNFFNASTTVGTVTLSNNNAFTAGEKRYVSIGTPASSPTEISCTIRLSITAD